MPYEYKVVPAPARGVKAKGVKGAEARFAHAVEGLMNELAAENWEYLRADTLPTEERSGLTSSVRVWRSLLVFRRAVPDEGATAAPVDVPMAGATGTGTGTATGNGAADSAQTDGAGTDGADTDGAAAPATGRDEVQAALADDARASLTRGPSAEGGLPGRSGPTTTS